MKLAHERSNKLCRVGRINPRGTKKHDIGKCDSHKQINFGLRFKSKHSLTVWHPAK